LLPLRSLFFCPPHPAAAAAARFILRSFTASGAFTGTLFPPPLLVAVVWRDVLVLPPPPSLSLSLSSTRDAVKRRSYM
jgi:hypothetical protein